MANVRVVNTLNDLDDIPNKKFVVEGGTKSAAFLLSRNFVDIIQGPVGSGKTDSCCTRLMLHMQEQAPSPLDGLRKTRWFAVRNTFPDLKRTTIRSWLEMFPEHVYGRFNWSMPYHHRMRWEDKLAEVDFLALDKPEDIRKLRSGQYTGGWINEIQYVGKEIFDECQSRSDRYPRVEEGGATWAGVIADANAPDEDHWLAMMTGQVDLPPGLTDEERDALGAWPAEWGFHLQPPALIEKFDPHGRVVGYEVNPAAENLKNLSPNYYLKQIVGKTKAWIDSRLMVRVVLVVEGSPVWPMFKRETHIASEALRPHAGHRVAVGLDFGRQPAAICSQSINNRVYVQRELLGVNEGAVTFAPKLRRFLAHHYPDHKLEDFDFWGDPKGQDKGQADERTAYDIFKANGMFVRPAPGLKQNMIATRVDAVAHLLNEMYDGQPRAVFCPIWCRTLNVGMQGRYHLVREEDGELRPKKDRYSNPCDALQYNVLGLGEGRKMTGRPQLATMKPVQVYRGRQSMRRVSA